MSTMTYIVIGIVMGAFSGLLGIGGGLILIPILVYFLHLTQHQAQGISLAVLAMPVAAFAAIRYYRAGNVNIGMAALIAAGFVVGSLLGAEVAHRVPDSILRKIFGIVMLAASLKMIVAR